jgi:hypothetical protein
MRRNSRPQNEVRVELADVFDVPTARRVEEAIAHAAPGSHLCVDLSHVREFRDFGIAILAQALKHRGGTRVALRGLRRHQERLLGYFGVDAGMFQPQAHGTAV